MIVCQRENSPLTQLSFVFLDFAVELKLTNAMLPFGRHGVCWKCAMVLPRRPEKFSSRESGHVRSLREISQVVTTVHASGRHGVFWNRKSVNMQQPGGALVEPWMQIAAMSPQ